MRNKKTKIPFLAQFYSMIFHKGRLWPTFIIVLLSGLGCKNSDSWVSKQWHNTTAHYNTFFNAEQTWLNTVLTLRESSKDDYRTFIEIYNYGPADALKANQGVMDGVIKQVSTMIDKHPKSKWVDDAYLLMGKAYFLKGDFVAASDLFEYVNTSFKDPTIQYTARLWILQSLYYQGKTGEAENLALGLKNDKNFPKNLLPELNKAIGAIYLRNNKPSQAIEPLLISLKKAKGKMDKYRLHFAIGQASYKTGKYDTAEYHFGKVVRMNPPYDMAFQARVSQVEILSTQKKEFQQANSILKKMLKDDKNIDYYGQIYYRMGMNELLAGNETKGLYFLNLSLRNVQNDKTQATTSYLALGDHYYGKQSYLNASLYYDSANRLLDESHPDYKNIAKRGTVLGELLRHLLTVKKQDSLIALAKDPVLREKTIDRLIELEKKKATEPRQQTTPAPSDNNNTANQTASSFPFYNFQQKNIGQAEFIKYWGERLNRDNWRISSKKSISAGNTETNEQDSTVEEDPDIPENISADRKKYYKEIPLTKEAQIEANTKIQEALYEAALLYLNSLNSPTDAISTFETLQSRYPGNKFEPQVYYELAKIYRNQNETVKFESYKNLLKEKYPESIYYKLLENPDSKPDQSEGPAAASREITALYEAMYSFFQKEMYDSAIAVKMRTDAKYAGNLIQNRFDYLYALCVIKKGNIEKGLELLKQIVVDYPDTDIAAKAQENIRGYDIYKNPVTAKTDTDTSTVAANWKKWDGKEELFFLLSYPRGGNSNLIRAGLNDFNKENFIFETLEVTAVRAVGETVYLTVNNFSKPENTQGYLKMLSEKPEFFTGKGLFEYELAWISKTNYLLLVENNRVNNYIEFFKTDKK